MVHYPQCETGKTPKRIKIVETKPNIDTVATVLLYTLLTLLVDAMVANWQNMETIFPPYWIKLVVQTLSINVLLSC